MSTSDIQQAKEWAESRANGNYLLSERAEEAVKVIQSLPDHWIDAEKVRELLHWREVIEQTPIRPTEAHLIALLHDLLAPSLPTLAELIEAGNDPQQYQWMQAMFTKSDHEHVITCIFENRSRLMRRADGMGFEVPNAEIIPLPGPKMEWPGDGVVDAPIVDGEPALSRREEVKPGDYRLDSRIRNSAVTSLPRPEDVPAGEAWLVGIRTGNGIQNDQKFFGIRSSGGTWELFDVDEGWHSRWGIPSEITLISRLVPEGKP